MQLLNSRAAVTLAMLLLAATVIVSSLLVLASRDADAQVIPGRHFACYAPNPQFTRSWDYLPDGTKPCPPGWIKIDWVDD